MLPGCMSAWKKPSRNTCVKKISTPARASFGMSMPCARRRSTWLTGRAVHALHHHHVVGAVVPVHLGHEEQRRAVEVAPELARVRRLAHEVELVVEVLVELGDHLVRPQALAVRPDALDQPAAASQQREIVAR